MFVKTTITGAVVAAAMAVGANAATIDFTSASTGHSGTVMGINWTMTASGILNNTQLYDGVGAKNAAQVLALFALSNLWMSRRRLLSAAG